MLAHFPWEQLKQRKANYFGQLNALYFMQEYIFQPEIRRELTSFASRTKFATKSTHEYSICICSKLHPKMALTLFYYNTILHPNRI